MLQAIDELIANGQIERVMIDVKLKKSTIIDLVRKFRAYEIHLIDGRYTLNPIKRLDASNNEGTPCQP